MQHLNNQLKVAFFIAVCYWALPISMYAQDGQKTRFKISRHKGDHWVTLTLPESVARELLAALLEEDGADPVEAKRYKVSPVHKKMMPVDPSPSLEGSKQVVRSIIGGMIRDSIVKDRDSFSWFALDGRQFVVDGKAVSDSLRVKFQSEYIKADGCGYYFGPVEVQDRGVFMDRSDVY